MRLHELQEARAKAVTAMRALADLAEREGRDLTEAEEKTYAEHKGAIAALDKKIHRQRELETLERAAPAIIARAGDGTFEARAREFSICRAIAAQLPGSGVDAGLERELSAETARRTGRKFAGIAVPDEVFLRPERRTLLAGSTAADLVPTAHRGDLMIDVLRAALVTAQLGATILDGLIGNVEIPRQTSSSQAQWVGEDGSLTETDATFADVELRPRTVGAMTSFSRRTLINAVPSIEDLVRRDLAAVIASAIDLQAMIGDGQGNRPTGITGTAGVGQITLASGPTWEKVLQFIATVQQANVAATSPGWALSPFAAKRLRATPRISGDGAAGFIMESGTALAGHPVGITSALPGDGAPNSPTEPALVIFGNWSDLLIGYWSGTDILVNPFESTAYAKGRVLVRAMRDVDVAARHAEAFVYSDDMPVEAS